MSNAKLSDVQWRIIYECLLLQKGIRTHSEASCRQFVEAVLRDPIVPCSGTMTGRSTKSGI